MFQKKVAGKYKKNFYVQKRFFPKIGPLVG